MGVPLANTHQRPAPDAGAPDRPVVLRSERELRLGPRTTAQLLTFLEQKAPAVLVAALETAGHDVDDGWALRGELRLERVGTPARAPAQTNGAPLRAQPAPGAPQAGPGG